MTRTYNDSDALTRLLEEKERDLELAAHIGKNLLEEKKELRQQVEELEASLTQCQDSVTQLRHELSLKASLLQIYSAQEDSPDATTPCDEETAFEVLNRKISILEQENTELKCESQARISSLETEEKKEIQLINDCIKQLSNAAKESCNLQEELSRRTEASLRQQEEISSLMSHVAELQRTVKELRMEAEELRSQLNGSHTVQEEMAKELFEVRSRYAEVLEAFQELQAELRRKSSMPTMMATREQGTAVGGRGGESLARELRVSLGRGEGDSFFNLERPHKPMYRHRRRTHWSQSEESQDSDNNEDSQYSSLSSIGFSPHKDVRPHLGELGRCHTPDSFTSEGSFLSRGRLFRIPDKLQLVKPLEGSQTLQQWQQLAMPGLGGIFKNIEGIRMKGAQEASLSLQMKGLALETLLSREQEVTHPACNFGSVQCVFTATTSSGCTSSTNVTSSCKGPQLATSVLTRINAVPKIGRVAAAQGLAAILQEEDIRASLPKVVLDRHGAAPSIAQCPT
ncbi:trafficking kinesin-binding protein 2-like isoform X2 [Ornithodoros turicata]|uniref:trafficking kinesin-binding protein 2-like isoform X2 n=1 Tax=Ornithodoros turicata TaxID=34597 RepID=UPI003139DB7F